MRLKNLINIITLIVLPILLISGCNTSNKISETTAKTAGSSKFQATPGILNPAEEAEFNVKNITSDGIKYNVSEYLPAKQAVYNYGGNNLALRKKVTSSGCYDGYKEYSAVDGNIVSLWASSADIAEAWLQVDLGSKQTIGRVEIVARQDGGNANHRIGIAVLASNDPEFKTYEQITELGNVPFKDKGTWISNCETKGKYQYVRLQRMYHMGHFTVGEFRVFDTKAASLPVKRAVEIAPAGAQMIISRSGKALSVFKNNAVLQSYDFINSQRWLIVEGNGGCFIKNIALNKYLTKDSALVLADKTGADNQTWLFEELGAGWKRITNKNGGVLTLSDGYLAIASQSSGNKFEMWDISDAYIENLKKADTSWMTEDGYGIMYHLIPDVNTRRIMEKNIDVKGISDQIEESGAKYFLLCTGQNTGYYNSPNEKFTSMISYTPRTRTTKTDFPMEIAFDLKKRGIKLMMYATTRPPTGIKSDLDDFYNSGTEYTTDSAILWSFVLREWSQRYGDLVSGWWIDGGLEASDPIIYTILTNAVKSGNKNAVVANNPGICIMPLTDSDEYTAGETDYPFGSDDLTKIKDQNNWMLPSTCKITDRQWFMLTFLSKGWCHNLGPRRNIYDSELWADYISKVHKEGGAICLDVNYKPNDNYKMNDEMLEILKAVKTKFYSEEKTN